MIIEIRISYSGICEEVSNSHQDALSQEIISNLCILAVIMWEEPKQIHNQNHNQIHHVFTKMCFIPMFFHFHLHTETTV